MLSTPYERYYLTNGLEVILAADNSTPIVAVNLLYKVGSANEGHRKSGLAHLFEHMMFQGSLHISKGKHFQYIEETGGSLNANTTFDRTVYYDKVPSNYLEMALWLESDRMGYFLPTLVQETLTNQIDVVTNERLEHYDNAPYGLGFEKILQLLFPEEHPYRRPIIGYMSDIQSIEMEDVQEFFTTFYTPSNAVLLIHGDFETEEARYLVEKYFGEIKGSPKPPEPETIPEFFLKETVLEVFVDKVHLPMLLFGWPSVRAFSREDIILSLIGDFLTGSKNARLHKKFVFVDESLQSIGFSNYTGKYHGMNLLTATVKPGIDLDEIEKEILAGLHKAINSEITDEEIERIKYGYKVQAIYKMQSVNSIASRMNEYNFYIGDPDYMQKLPGIIEDITAQDMLAVAQKYFTRNYVRLLIVPGGEVG
jgi:zinc protease